MMAVEQYRRRMDVRPADQFAAKYTPGESLDDLITVAHMADSYREDVELAEVSFDSGVVLLVRYRKSFDDHPSKIDYEVVEPGRYLAYSEENDFLYTADDANWRQFYERV